MNSHNQTSANFSNLCRSLRQFLFSSTGRWTLVALCLTLAGAQGLRAYDSARVAAAMQQSNSPDGVWEETDGSLLQAQQDERRIMPAAFRPVRLNQVALNKLLSRAPLEFTAAARQLPVEMTLPLPEGSFASFRIVESPMMEPELAAKYPEIKTYAGQGIDDPTATVRFDVTPAGFHAIIITERGAIYIDPFAKNDRINHLSYYKRDLHRERNEFVCATGGQVERLAALGATTQALVVTGGTLHRYRLALAATAQYTNFFRQAGDNDAQARARALAAMTTSMNRVNGIFEREVNVRMVFIANEDAIIYTDTTTDPYAEDGSGNNTDAIGGQNQTSLDMTIGNGNYDIGHVFGIGGGGNAGGIGTVCGANKGGAFTSRGNPTGDTFDVDFVAHEMGHQFGGTHTFNDSTNCDSGQYTAASAYEPGSGSTIMSYAGICGTGNVQANSDAYFHIRSLEQIVATVNGHGCDTEIATGNNAPTVNAGANFTIPQQTPFVLTATGNDPDGDALTFVWEQYDTGTASPPETDNGNRPIFRSFNPTANAARTFPQFASIVNTTTSPFETLPSTNRTLNFQVTARDNRAGGGVRSAQMQVDVTTTSGPFRLTSPNAAASWPVGTTQTVTWDVAGTTGAPVSAANVRIVLVRDCETITPTSDCRNVAPIVLAVNTPNDGSETIVVPNAVSNNARILIEAVGNIFFDISDNNFTIQPSADLQLLAKVDAPDPVVTGSLLTYTITVRNNGPNAATNAVVTDTLPAGALFNSCQATGGGACGGAGQNREVVFATLAAGATEVITLTATANCGLSDGAVINNTTAIGAATFDPNPGNNSGAAATVAQNPPPVITCPANFDATAATPGSTTAIVNFADPLVTDNCPGATVVCTPASGSAFPLGATTVNCTATDSGGATASCSFVVTVWDVIIQDDENRDYILFNSFTGDYKFVHCGVDGFVMIGRGEVTREGCVTRLRDDTRVVGAAFDRCLIAPRNTGGAKIKRRQPDTTFVINDRDILNNSPTCP